ncbi:hypothetical protein LARI1_G005557 [Lachnellula arida]|uniref:Uncharacterized protein n=1 Tax=Lachnellula arida TaxID=1316785 RepID=A0A8T9BF05_9HELO|nr:hypothetical protein LARI1_G005557 [Lachnellula arida]
MDTGDQFSALGVANPYNHIDIGWVEQRLNEQAGVRRSRLAAYFDGYMEFTEQPPALSRSPTPEPQDHSHRVRPTLDSSQRRSSDKGGAARLPRRRGTFESESDATDTQQPRKRRWRRGQKVVGLGGRGIQEYQKPGCHGERFPEVVLRNWEHIQNMITARKLATWIKRREPLWTDLNVDDSLDAANPGEAVRVHERRACELPPCGSTAGWIQGEGGWSDGYCRAVDGSICPQLQSPGCEGRSWS